MITAAHIADRVLNRPLMIMPEKLAMIAQVLDGKIGIDASSLITTPTGESSLLVPEASRYVGEFDQVDPNNPRAGRKPYRTTSDGVAIIPVLGSLVNRGGFLDALSGLTSYEKLKFQVGAAARDDAVRSIILDMDSPGGEAVGAFEAADAVRNAAQAKEVVAVVNGVAASAAYAIAAAASKVITTRSGISGSIGVVMLHADHSQRLHDAGIKVTLIHAGARKVDGNPYQALTDVVTGELKTEIEKFMTLFVNSVAAFRPGLTPEAIIGFEARTYLGEEAVSLGLADSVGNFENALADLSNSGKSRTAPTRKGKTMSEVTVTNADHDAAVAAARTAGLDEGKRELQAAVAAATAVATTAERDRVKAITTLENAKGREATALNLALTSDLSADQVKGVLSSLPKASAQGERSGDSAIGLTVGTDGNKAPGADAGSSWDKALTKAGAKMPAAN